MGVKPPASTMRAMRSIDRFWPHALAAGVVAIAGQALLGAWIGLDLHLFFAGVLLVMLMIPPLSAVARGSMDRLLLSVSATLGLALAWLLPPARAAMSSSIEWHLVMVLLAWTLALAATSGLLTRLFRESTLGSATTLLLALAWLSAPVWLGVHAAAIVRMHPLFAINTVLIDLGFWTEQPVEYRYLFALGQDVPYLLPSSVWPSVFLHGAIGLIFSVIAEMLPGKLIARP